ncbi:MAG: hypothetical protein H6985_04125 [Pseudomonadales bacterium]|nr:hypothetical protein [Halioglobus sp.]MCP5128754.1 hypothetical protein [Pseudomonadales bacterium]
MIVPKRIPAAVVVFLAALSAPLVAAEPAADTQAGGEKSELCLNLIRIDSSKILDSKHMLFIMTDKTMYLNTFPLECPGLKPGDAYKFRTPLNQLCNQDLVTKMTYGGQGFIPGVSCGLGKFVEISQEQVDALQQKIKAK